VIPVNITEIEDGPLGPLALSRSGVDRVTKRREDHAWLDQAWADPRSRVLVVRDFEVPVATRDGELELVFVPPAAAPEGTRLLLGVDAADVAYWGVLAAVDEDASTRSDSPDVKQMGLRQAGALLSDRDAGLLTHAVALAYWHATHTHCPQCGTPTMPAPAGHLTICPKDSTQHFPRLDPAVIMLVIDADDRLMLARNALWPAGRMSVVAGFVEPGESAEHAVAREVFEETAVVVGQVSYLGSQPWPMPRSLMLGYTATALGRQQISVDEEEIGEARWFTRAELLAAIEAGELGIAPTTSIARRLIEYWYGAELPDGRAAWPGGRR
jgi:NAD+ diphosphatase